MALLTTTSDVAVNIKGHYDRNLLERALPLLIHDRFAQVRPVPKNAGTQITFRRYGALAIASQLSEGVTPSGKKAQTSDINATLVQFGDYLTYTDWLKMTSLDPTLAEFSMLLGEQSGDTLDQYHRDNMVAGTNVRYADDAANRAAVNDPPAATDLKAILRILEGNDSKKVREKLTASTRVATQGLRPSYIGITHVDARQDYEDIAGFTPVEQYASQSDVMDGEIGEYKGIRFIGTTNAKIRTGTGSGTTNSMVNDGSNVNVYTTIIFGKNFYGTVPLQRKSIENIIKKLGSAGSNDPLDQRGTSGWKAFISGIILNDDFGVRYEHGVTDL